MTSDEIKDMKAGRTGTFWLKEIAYQLAVLNEKFSDDLAIGAVSATPAPELPALK